MTAPLSVRCPYCFAEPGRPCVQRRQGQSFIARTSPSGRSYAQGRVGHALARPHWARAAAAGVHGVPGLSVFDGASRDELLFMAGAFYLDNRRLRRLIALRLGPLAMGMDGAAPLGADDRADVAYAMICFAEDVGEPDLADALRRVRWRRAA